MRSPSGEPRTSARAWADATAARPDRIHLPQPPEISFFSDHDNEKAAHQAIHALPRPLQLALAVTSTDARDPVHAGACGLHLLR